MRNIFSDRRGGVAVVMALCVSVVVETARGEEALKCLKAAFRIA